MRRDQPPVNLHRLSVGAKVVARTRWGGLRHLHLRLVGTSSTGRRFVLGHSRHGVVRRAWVDDIIHVERPPRG